MVPCYLQGEGLGEVHAGTAEASAQGSARGPEAGAEAEGPSAVLGEKWS